VTDPTTKLLPFIVDRVNMGIFVLDRELNVLMWNRFMALHSGKEAEQVVGRPVTEVFPETNQRWLRKKVESVFMLGNLAFTSWEQRPYVMAFPHHRPITSDVDFMRQDCTFMPLRNKRGQVTAVCVTVNDGTDAFIYQSQLQEAMVKLEAANRTDGLTKVNNRTYWLNRLEEEVCRVERHETPLTVTLFDLDHFKQVNDTMGHLAGDQVLREVAERVQKMLRTSDVMGRYGGEEFGILLPHTDLWQAMQVVDRIRQNIAAKPVVFNGTEIPVTASFGVAQWHQKLARVDEFLSVTDEALYEAKRSGRDRCIAAKMPYW